MRQFITIFDKGPGMNKEEMTGWAEMAHKTSDRMDLNIIRDADKLEADNARVDEYGFPLAPFQAGA